MREAMLEARRVLETLLADGATIEASESLAAAVTLALSGGHRVLACGNGGSACDASHFAEEFTGRFRKDRRPLPVMALNDAAHITCTANDYGYEHVFARQVSAFGQRDDLLVVLSTSGNSPSIIRAVEAADEIGMSTASLLGRGGGMLKGRCDIQIIVPGETADRIQELHMLILHAAIERVERVMFPQLYTPGPAR